MSVLKALKVTYLFLMVVYFVLMEWLSFMRSIFIDTYFPDIYWYFKW